MSVEHGLSNLEVLSRRYAISVLKFILKNGPELKFSDLGGIVTTYHTLVDLLSELESEKLVMTWQGRNPYKTNYVKLTPVGARVAEYLLKIEEVMAGREPEVEDQPNHGSSADVRGEMKHASG